MASQGLASSKIKKIKSQLIVLFGGGDHEGYTPPHVCTYVCMCVCVLDYTHSYTKLDMCGIFSRSIVWCCIYMCD